MRLNIFLKIGSEAIKEGATVKDVIKSMVKSMVGAIFGVTVDQIVFKYMKWKITKMTHLYLIHLLSCFSLFKRI